jgi:hypothetical protein
MSNRVYIEKRELPSAMLDRLIRIAAFQNPEFYRAQAMRLSTYGKPRIISCGEDFPEHLGLPRGCVDYADVLVPMLAGMYKKRLAGYAALGYCVVGNECSSSDTLS